MRRVKGAPRPDASALILGHLNCLKGPLTNSQGLATELQPRSQKVLFLKMEVKQIMISHLLNLLPRPPLFDSAQRGTAAGSI